MLERAVWSLVCCRYFGQRYQDIENINDPIDAVVLSGGTDIGRDPGRDQLESAVLVHAAERCRPCLICRECNDQPFPRW